jgi:hypothetical protein
MEIKSRPYKINEKELLFRPNMRAMIDFERATGKSVDESVSTEDHVTFLFCGTVAGMKKAGRDFSLTLDDYIDLIDGDFSLLSDLMEVVEEDDSEKK